LDQDILIIEATRSHSGTAHLTKHNTHKRERHTHPWPGGIRTCNRSKQAASGLRLRL